MNNCSTVLSSLTPTRRQSNGRWSKTEHQRFMKALEKYGRDWVSVQKYIKTRNLSQVRSHAQKVFLKMSDQDVVALIAVEGESDIQNCDRSFCNKSETHVKKNNIKQTQTLSLQKKSVQKNPTKVNKNLLDIFKQAIQLENRQIKDEKKQINIFRQIKPNQLQEITITKINQKSPEQIEKQHQALYLENQHKIYQQQVTQNLLEYQQMQFQFPKFIYSLNLIPQTITEVNRL